MVATPNHHAAAGPSRWAEPLGPGCWQLRQPIYASLVERWKTYENRIQLPIQALGDLAEV